jgi:beta-glucosidase
MPTIKKKKYLNYKLPVKERVEDLVSRLTLDEKVEQMMHPAPAIPRLGVPEYNWWNEGLHGVARAGSATVFPQAIGMAASFNDRLLNRVAAAISEEARAKHHLAVKNGNRGIFFGLTYWSPNINIFRDPRWGRGQETYGEDPFLTARMGVAFVRGLQGSHPKYLKLVATPKHYAVHSGPESERHRFNAVATRRDMYETYLPAFRACVQEAGAWSIMGAYNRTNGEPCCASKILLQEILRNEWGFEGYVVSDCWAIEDIHAEHRIVETAAESAAMAVKNGCDLNCGNTYAALMKSVEKGLINEQTISRALARLFTARFKLGMFDPPARVPFTKISTRVIECKKHRTLARKMAQESIVLLKNENSLLPLDLKKYKNITVVGPQALDKRFLLGNYYGYSKEMVTPFEGILRAVSPGTQVGYTEGCDLIGNSIIDPKGLEWHTRNAEIIIAVLGFSPILEGEEGENTGQDGDRTAIDLPGRQEELLKMLHRTGKPVVLVLTGGSAIAVNWANENIPAILMVWYPGEEGGNAIADVLFGKCNPAGRLPVTFVKSLDQVPDFRDYNMKHRTYRFMEEEPLYRFGYGLSYTTFKYSKLKLNRKRIASAETVKISVNVKNTGKYPGEEVVQLYISDIRASVPVPLKHLEGFRRIRLVRGQKKCVSFMLKPAQLAAYDENGRCFIEPGEFQISVGGGQPEDPAANSISTRLTVTE